MRSKRQVKKTKPLIEFWARHDARLRIIPLFNSNAINRRIVKRADAIRRDFNQDRYTRKGNE